MHGINYFFQKISYMIKTKRLYLANTIIALLPNTSLMSFKAKLWRWAGINIGKNVEIFQGAKIQGTGNVTIKDNVFIGHEVLILVNKGSNVIIGESSVISTRVLISAGFHSITPDGERIIGRDGTTSDIIIGKGAAVLMDAKVLPGVNIGEMSMVGAGAVVNKDVKPYTLVAGVPIKEIRLLK